MSADSLPPDRRPAPPDEPGLPKLDLAALDRYFAGELSPEDARALRRTLTAHPSLAALAEQFRTLPVAPPGRTSISHERGRALISGLLGADTPWRSSEGATPPVTPVLRRGGAYVGPRRKPLVALVGAALLVVAAMSALIVWRGGVESRSERSYATSAGQRAVVTLDDGTQVTLAPASRLAVAPTYGHARRDVTLEGEAYFAVVHDGHRPFTVRARRALATDVGTTFDVRAYASDNAVRIAVAEGRVSITRTDGIRAAHDADGGTGLRPAHLSQQTADTLGAGDLATVADTTVALAHGAEIAALTAWTSGRLVFRGTPLRETLAEIGRWYDLELRADDPTLGARIVTATFEGDPVDKVLRAVANAADATYEQRGRTVVFRARS